MDPAGNTGNPATVSVSNRLPPAAEKIPQGSFGATYRDLVPQDATIEEYATHRFSLVTGLVFDIEGQPVSEVTAGIHGHPEYGTVATDASGRFSIPVEGGGTLTVAFQKQGLITSHRQVDVPWNDYAIVEPVRMIAEDSAATVVTFDGNASP